MAELARSVMTLRIGGDDLIPSEISQRLGVPATHGQTKGEHLVGRTGTIRIAKSGLWRLQAKEREPEDMDGQIEELLSQTTSDLSVWRELGSKYSIDLFCGLFMKCSNEGVTLSAKSLLALGERGTEMGLDIYGGSEDEE